MTETDMQFLEMIEGAMEGGARGVAIGCNVFQADDPVKTTMPLGHSIRGQERKRGYTDPEMNRHSEEHAGDREKEEKGDNRR